jgi:hypothetical protein
VIVSRSAVAMDGQSLWKSGYARISLSSIFIDDKQQKFNNLPALKMTHMLEEYERKKRHQISLMRSVANYGMGVFFICLGIFFFFREKFNIDLNKSNPPNYVDKIMGVAFVLYGAWRVYRGYKKNYFK